MLIQKTSILWILVSTLFMASQTVAAQQIQITGVNDISFGSYGGSGDLEESASVCIYKTSGNRNYYVTITAFGGGALELSGSTSDTIPISVGWRKVGNANYKNQKAGVSKRHGGANKSAADCGGVDNAEYRISVSANNLDVASDSYSGSFVILIEPD